MNTSRQMLEESEEIVEENPKDTRRVRFKGKALLNLILNHSFV